jgi:alkylation response protein AidB-like acyl-CoA dehydrogenase
MAFFQDPPRLGNQLDDDALLGEYLARQLPDDVADSVLPDLSALGELAGGELREEQAADRLNEPRLTQWDPWGRRIDRLEVTRVWERARLLAAEWGLVATAYEQRHGRHSRIHQFAMNYVIGPSTDTYSCPLAMSDGAARTLLDLGNRAINERAYPRLISRDPLAMWTSGQWMTERTGGSDVGQSETVARHEGDEWRLYGTKWFTSAVGADMTLALARTPDAPSGGRGLTLFYLELKDAEGRWNGISVNRLKDKLGTKKVPTAELTLDGAVAIPVAGLGDGVRNITPMLSITRTWNAVMSAAGMRRGLALARDYSRRRVAFGTTLAEKPLHRDTLAGLAAELEGAFLITFRAVELLGAHETRTAGERDEKVLRLLTPLIKLTTAKQAVATASEILECFGGAGYVEDTGMPALLRDAQVLPIWEGTTNVLSLDALRALAKDGTFEALAAEFEERLAAATDPGLARPVAVARAAMKHATEWIMSRQNLESGARRFALTLGRAFELALLCDHAQWCLANHRSKRSMAAARRLAQNGVDLIVDGVDESDARDLAGGS